MIWPPVKAWTSKAYIDGQVHFVAINYGGELPSRWVILMSVLDSTVVVKVPWSQLVDLSNWEPGWDEINHREPSKLVNNKSFVKTNDFFNPSFDSGLTIPISENIIRPWFKQV
ncbi:TIGR02450 family Trp-rich protein [Prochlorococcus marinus]|uniref:TIGR02450 family Trp-rich protein n=1 Tax=Prochlorococcus marinus TaxID=1219 RepID=UPI0022B4EE9C|nr:TIGR02450 family Trp-rich protein [Prochlorococcus marinus]